MGYWLGLLIFISLGLLARVIMLMKKVMELDKANNALEDELVRERYNIILLERRIKKQSETIMITISRNSKLKKRIESNMEEIKRLLAKEDTS